MACFLRVRACYSWVYILLSNFVMLTDRSNYLGAYVRKEFFFLTIRFVGSLLPMGGVLCAKFFDPRPIGGRNMAISKICAKIWPKLDFFQIAPVWPKIGFWSSPNIFHTRLVWENTLDTKKWDFVFRKMSICCV
jgi:hypothetical protein